LARSEPIHQLGAAFTGEIDRAIRELAQRLSKEHETISEGLSSVVEAIQGMLESKDIKVQERGIKLWMELSTKAYNKDMGLKKFLRDVGDRMLQHTEKMSGVSAEPAWMQKGLDE
jgi:hypothetical protein